MCLINLSPKDDPEPVVPPRLVAVQPPSRPRSHYSVSAAMPTPIPIPLSSQTPRHSASHISPRVSLTRQINPHPAPGQVIVIDQRTPRTSGALSIRDSSGGLVQGQVGYIYGQGPVVLRTGSVNRRPGLSVQNSEGHRRSGSLGVERRQSAVYGKDPRASNASYRSTRERIVIVDGNGTRREYIR